MSPDSALGQLAQRVARIEQRMEDAIARFSERITDVLRELREFREEADRDYRSFAPMVREHHELRSEVHYVKESVAAMPPALKALEARFEEEKRERIEGQRLRKEELDHAIQERTQELARIEAEREKRDREFQATVIQQKTENRRLLYGIIGIFITAAGGVLAQILNGGGG